MSESDFDKRGQPMRTKALMDETERYKYTTLCYIWHPFPTILTYLQSNDNKIKASYHNIIVLLKLTLQFFHIFRIHIFVYK